MSDKVYIGTGKEKEGKYGTFMRFSIPQNELDILSQQARENNGWANITINKRREPSANGATHYGLLDTWKPERREGPSLDSQQDKGEDDLPF